jgi:hypothetical protein
MELILSIVDQLEPENIKSRYKLEEKHLKICQKSALPRNFSNLSLYLSGKGAVLPLLIPLLNPGARADSPEIRPGLQIRNYLMRIRDQRLKSQCCGSGIRFSFDPGIRDGKKNPDLG